MSALGGGAKAAEGGGAARLKRRRWRPHNPPLPRCDTRPTRPFRPRPTRPTRAAAARLTRADRSRTGEATVAAHSEGWGASTMAAREEEAAGGRSVAWLRSCIGSATRRLSMCTRRAPSPTAPIVMATAGDCTSSRPGLYDGRASALAAAGCLEWVLARRVEPRAVGDAHADHRHRRHWRRPLERSS